MPPDPVARAAGLTKRYGDTTALDRLDLAIAPGEVFGLLGPNGSGKSTALRLLLGFLRPTAGDAWVGPHHSWHDAVRARKRVAYLPGELRLYERMTGRQLVRFLARLRGDRPDAAAIDRLSKRFSIDLDRPLVQMSSGMKRKVALLQVLLPAVPLVILDEPTNALDPTMRDELLGMIREARDGGRAVLFSSHVLTEVEATCNRVGILQAGKLAHLQTMDELKEERLLTVRLAAAPPAWPDLPGLEVSPQKDGAFRLFQTGPLAPLLAWLGTQDVRDLRVEASGLATVYHRYHGAADQP